MKARGKSDSGAALFDFALRFIAPIGAAVIKPVDEAGLMTARIWRMARWLKSLA
jgi:hypothetical protein